MHREARGQGRPAARAVRGWRTLLAGTVLGTLGGLGYAALAGVLHRGVSGRWDRVPAFAVAAAPAGAGLGLAVAVLIVAAGGRRLPAPASSPRCATKVAKSPARDRG
jgi:hypothetical protein